MHLIIGSILLLSRGYIERERERERESQREGVRWCKNYDMLFGYFIASSITMIN